MKYFKNKFGNIPEGSKVYFRVEDQDQWCGDNTGILTYEDKKWIIKTENSGVIKIGEWLGAYSETIEPLEDYKEADHENIYS